MIPPTRRALLAGLLTAAGGLAGCGSLPGLGSFTDTYDLTAPTDARIGGGAAAQFLVPEPQTLKLLDSERVLSREGAAVSYVSGIQWSDRLPRLFQARLIQTMEGSGRFKAVGRPGQGLAIDYQVVTDIRRFEYVPSQRRAVVEISAKLMNDRNGHIVGGQVFKAEAPVAVDSGAAIVAGLDVASDQVLLGMIKWLLRR